MASKKTTTLKAKIRKPVPPRNNGKKYKKRTRTPINEWTGRPKEGTDAPVDIAENIAAEIVAGNINPTRTRVAAGSGRRGAPPEFLFKPGEVRNPTGRPRGALSLTARLRKMLALPVRFPGIRKADLNYTYADKMIEMAVAATARGDFKFFKEIFERIDGKVPDHVITESAKQMVGQQATAIATQLLEEVGKLVDRYLDDDQAEEFMGMLASSLAERFKHDNYYGTGPGSGSGADDEEAEEEEDGV